MNHPRRSFFWSQIIVVGLVCAIAGRIIVVKSRRTPSVPAANPPPADAGSIPGKAVDSRLPQVWVIAVGVDQYQDQSIPSCHGAVRAARAIGDWFIKTAGWNSNNVLRLDDLGEATHDPKSGDSTNLLPTRENLNWACNVWLADRVRPDDVVVLYFAGQAVALAEGRDRQYLLPADAHADAWEQTAWRPEEAIDRVAASGRNQVICWLDTSLAGRGKLVKGGVAEASAAPMLQRIVRWPGVTAWIAADGRPAVEARRVGDLSPFTASLLQSLGSSERPNNLHASLNTLSHDKASNGQGFRFLGGVDPGVNLWSSRVERSSLLKRELLLQRGHAGGISDLAFSADGGRFVTGSQDSTVKIWNASDSRILRALSYHMVGVASLALSPNGGLLATGDGAGWVRLWDVVKQREIPPLPPHDRGIARLGFLPDGARLIGLDMDGKCWLRDVSNPSAPLRSVAENGSGLAFASGPGAIGCALATTDGKVLFHEPDGSVGGTLDGPGGLVSSPGLATDGKLVAAGGDGGQFALWNSETRAEILHQVFDAPIDVVGFAPSGTLAVASGKVLRLVEIRDGKASEARNVALSDRADRLIFSADGRWMAAATKAGSLHLWRLAEKGGPQAVALEKSAETGRTTIAAFSPDGRKIVSGDQDGGLRTWDLPDGNQRPRVLARRGQIAALSVSDDGRHLLQVSQDRQAQVWDLQEGRGLQRIDGEWTTGVISPDHTCLYLTSQAGGDVVCVVRETGIPRQIRFPRPEARNGPGKATGRFGRLAVSADGRWVAAGSVEGPLACVWETQTGKLVQTLRGHQEPHPITAVGFSADAQELLTASEDGTAKLWNLGDHKEPARETASYAMTDEASGEPVPITAAQMTRERPHRIVTGGINGRVSLWREGERRPIDLGTLDRAILAAAFTPDGKWLTVGGADKSVWLYEISRPERRLRLEPSPQHSEQVNALVAWPHGKIVASGSDDTTIRLWGLADRSLLGTLSAEQGTTDWVAYTPDGLFDSSLDGEKQVTWLVDREILSLEQVYDRFHVFKLTDQLRQGLRPKAPEPPREAPPRLSVVTPPRPEPNQRVAELTIRLSEPNLTNVRLYQNGAPVQADGDLTPGPDPRRLSAKVRLRHGANRFYVMASRAGSTEVEGRSQSVEVYSDGPDTPGRLHILSVGVSQYKEENRALQFAGRDAKTLAEFLHERGIADAGEPGLKIVLTDDQVSEESVDEAFRKVRDVVKGRPEDAVVVFLAGHADVLNERFYLLLPTFPFQKSVDPRSGRPRLAEIPRAAVLPYVALYRNVARLQALQRLVVVDACQAEAINDDPGVRQIQALIDSGAHRARTAYLMGARRGEPANEAGALEHGLLTYALLRGMRAPALEKVAGLAFPDDVPDADRNHDGVVSTDELHWYAESTLPKLATNFPLLVQRTGAGALPPIRPLANLNQMPRLQASDASFPLIELPKESIGNPTPAAR